MLRGLERPPWWAVVVIVVGVVWLIVGGAMAFRPHADPLTRAESDHMNAAMAAAEASDAAADPVLIAVYGDSFTAGSGEGGTGANGWPAIVQKRLGDTIVTHAAGGAGYVAVSPFSHGTFVDEITGSPEPKADVVVVFGSRNDAGRDAAAIGHAAAAAYQSLRDANPTAKLVVIGPCWSDGDPPQGALDARDAVRQAAEAAGATFVDPLADGWFADRPDLIGSDNVHPTDAGHVYLADKIEPVLRAALG